MLTTPVHRYAKPKVHKLTEALPAVSLQHQTRIFVDRTPLTRRNRALFDVMALDGRVIDRRENIAGLAYDFVGTDLVMAQPGSYVVREYTGDLNAADAATVSFGKIIEMSDDPLFRVGVPFWPEILSQPEGGLAKQSADTLGIAVCCPTPGTYSINYRLRNYLGQVSEPECLILTII